MGPNPGESPVPGPLATQREVALVRGVQHDLDPKLNALVHVLYEGTSLCSRKPRQQAAPKGKPPDLDAASTWPSHHYWIGYDAKGAKLANCLTCHVRVVELLKDKREQAKRDREWQQSQRAQGDGKKKRGGRVPPVTTKHPEQYGSPAGGGDTWPNGEPAPLGSKVDDQRDADGRTQFDAVVDGHESSMLDDLRVACDKAVADTSEAYPVGVVTDKQVEQLDKVAASAAHRAELARVSAMDPVERGLLALSSMVSEGRLDEPPPFMPAKPFEAVEIPITPAGARELVTQVRKHEGTVGPLSVGMTVEGLGKLDLVERAELAAAEVTIERLIKRLDVWTHLQPVDLDTAELLRIPLKRTDVVRVVGFDPGFRYLGIMAIDFAPSSVRAVFMRKITTTTEMPDPERLDLLAREIEAVVHRLSPTCVGYEGVAGVAAGQGAPKSAAAYRLLEVIGMIRSSCVRWRTPCHVVAVASAKVAALGSGNTRGASKQDIKDALQRMLGLRRLNSELADAGSVALATYSLHAGLTRKRPHKPRKKRQRRRSAPA